MADEFQGGVCGGNWWTYSRNNMFGSSLCSSGVINDIGGGFGWSGDLFDINTRSTDDSSLASSNGSLVLQDGSLFTNNGSSESNYSCMQQDGLNSGMNYGQESGTMNCHQIQKEWSPKSYTSEIISDESSTNNTFKPVDQNFMDSITAVSQGLSSYAYPSNLVQALFDSNTQKPTFDNQSMDFPTSTNYFASFADFTPSLPKLSASMLKAAASLPKKQQVINELPPFSGGSPLWNVSAASLSDIRPTLLPLKRLDTSPSITDKVNFRNLTAKRKNEEVAKKTNDENTFKRPRIETPSPLPTFKVRKEKLGDRITALQQLVSPFGKTDTASVLHEAIDYIKFLHNQVSALSNPYLRNGSQRQQTGDKVHEKEGLKQDLRSRGLCLVPISSTFPVAAETTADFWTPTFGGGFMR